MKIPAILKNKYVLYLVLVLSILNILGYLNIGDFDSVVLFCVVGVLSSYYNKNMTVNLLMSIVVTGLVYNVRNRNRYRFFEGMDASLNCQTVNCSCKGGAAANDADGSDKCCQWMNQSCNKEGMTSKRSSDTNMSEEKYIQCISGCNIHDDKKKKVCKSKCKSQEKMANKLNYASVDGEDDSDDDDEGIGARIDQDSTSEKALDNLQKVLGKGGIKGLTGETKKLMEQQKMLMGSIKEMKPMMDQAQEMMKHLPDMSNLFGKN